MEYIRIKNWDKFQNYKKYHPPWIKVWNDLLLRYEFQNLSDTSKAILLCLWLLNSQLGNGKIPTDTKWLRKNLPIKGAIKLQPLIKAGFIEITDVRGMFVEHSSTRDREETETEADKEAEADKKFVPPTISQINEYIQENPELSNIDPEDFWKGYSDGGWIDTQGNPVRNWKLKLRTRSKYGGKAGRSTEKRDETYIR